MTANRQMGNVNVEEVSMVDSVKNVQLDSFNSPSAKHVSVTPVRLRKMFVNQETVVVYADHLILEEVAKHVTEGIMGTQHAMTVDAHMLVHQQLNATNTAVNVDANQTTPVKNVTVAHPATTDTPPALHVAVTKKVPDHRTVI